jgi:small-conductance mechanosensitive channel
MRHDALTEDNALAALETAAARESEPEGIEREAYEERRESKARVAWIVPYLIAAAIALAGLIALRWDPALFVLPPGPAETIQRMARGVLLAIVVLAIGRAVDIYWIGRLANPVSRFNLKRILRLVIGIALGFVLISILFVEWYAAVVSLGLISLILGFALQTPISSFIGWIYILVRQPYRVGDRIEIGEARGDVIDVGYLDTTLWEIGGRYLSTDHPSGRMIKFPNTKVFDTPVFNYSWPLFPYVWNEIRLQVAYESDLQFVGQTMQRIAEDEVGEEMMKKVCLYRDLLARTPVDHLEVRERPSVQFRVDEVTWVDAIVRYLVEPRSAGRVKTALTRKILEALNAEPDRVLFPKSNAR